MNAKRLLLLLVILCACVLGGCAAKPSERVPDFAFRYAENQASDYPTTLAAFYFADRVAELSEGRIRIYVYPDAALGDERSVIEQMQYGGIDFSRVNLSPLSEYDNRLFTLQLPYLYQDNAHMWRVLEGEIGDMFLEGLSEINITGLAWVDAGARSFYIQDREVRTLEDMQGLRIRVQENSMMERLIEMLGAEPIKMRYDEVLAALQTGKIDGAENNLPSYCSTGHYLVATYMLEDEHSRIPEVIIASRAAMEKLSEADRQLVEAAAQEASIYQRELWREYEEKTRKVALDSGCVIHSISEEEKARFQDITTRMYEEFAAGDMDVIAAIQAM